jgi:hypothetical protein
MFAQGVGFAVWGVVAEFAAPRIVIALSAACGLAVVAVWRPRHTHAAKISTVA